MSNPCGNCKHEIEEHSYVYNVNREGWVCYIKDCRCREYLKFNAEQMLGVR